MGGGRAGWEGGLISGIEQRIYDTLSMRKDYTDKLFEEEEP